MGELHIEPARTALLMADFHRDSMGENPVVQRRGTFDRARQILDAARGARRGAGRGARAYSSSI